MGFTLIKNEAEWAVYDAKVREEAEKIGLLRTKSAGPQQYPAMAAFYLHTSNRPGHQITASADLIYSFVYAGDCVELLRSADPEAVATNLTHTGHVWAAEMVRKGYKDGDGPARFISQKLFSNLWSFLQELRVLIPTFIQEPAKVERGIDSVIVLETLVQRCTEDGDALAESDAKPMLQQLSTLAEEVSADGRKKLMQQLSQQIRQLQMLVVAGGKKSSSGPSKEEESRWAAAEQEDNFRRDISAKVMAIWALLTTDLPTEVLYSPNETLTRHYTQALRVIDEEMTQRKDAAASGEGSD